MYESITSSTILSTFLINVSHAPALMTTIMRYINEYGRENGG